MRKFGHANVVHTIELDPIPLTGGQSVRLRFEVLRQGERFVGRVLRWEFFRLQPTFPQKQGLPAHGTSDELVLVQDESLVDEIEGESIDEAVEEFFAQLERRFSTR